MKDIAKQYPLLTADERFRLFVEAMGRGDMEEVDRLETTCPRFTYTCQDWEYTRRKVRFTVFALIEALDLMRTDLLAYLALVVMLAGDDDSDEDGRTERATELFRQLMEVRRVKRNGWVHFCTQIGVAPDGITSPFLFGADCAREIAAAVAETLEVQGAAAAEDLSKRELDALLEAWAVDS